MDTYIVHDGFRRVSCYREAEGGVGCRMPGPARRAFGALAARSSAGAGGPEAGPVRPCGLFPRDSKRGCATFAGGVIVAQVSDVVIDTLRRFRSGPPTRLRPGAQTL